MNDIALTVINNTRTYNGQSNAARSEVVVKDEMNDRLISEGGYEFYRYVMSTGHPIDSILIVLSSRHHYYYDSDELETVKSIVVLEKLNRINEIESFLNSHLGLLPDECNLIGCFVNNQKIERYALRTGTTHSEKSKNTDNLELGIVSKFPFLNMIYSFMDSKTNSFMSEARVTMMLEAHGFDVINMTESDGLTFFHARKVESREHNAN